MSHTVVAWDRWYMGGASLSAGAGWPQRLWGSPAAGRPAARGRGARRRSTSRGNIPYNAARPGLAALRLREERPLAVLDRPHVGQGHEHTVKVGFEYRHHKFPHKGWAVGGAAGNFNFNRLGTGGLRRLGQQPRARPAIPLRRSCSGRCTIANQYDLRASRRGTRRTCRRGSTPSSRSTASSR